MTSGKRIPANHRDIKRNGEAKTITFCIHPNRLPPSRVENVSSVRPSNSAAIDSRPEITLVIVQDFPSVLPIKAVMTAVMTVGIRNVMTVLTL